MRALPEISRFFGISIRIYFEDHDPPHFHAIYGGREAQISIRDGEVIQGGLPQRALSMVREWSVLHRTELLENWELARTAQPLRRVEPLE